MLTSFSSRFVTVTSHPAPAYSHIKAAVAVAILFALSLTLTGCNLSGFSAASTASSTLPQISGHVHGGQQPVSGATIQLYAANTSVLQGASTALIASTVHSDANGGFTISGDYTCPAPGVLVYIVASGGNPGLPGTVSNANIALMAVLGTCGTLTSSTFVSVNELTTVAAVQSLAPFMLDYAHVGANASNVAGLTTAFNSATAFVDPGTGQFRAASANGVVAPAAVINTLADILAACINTSGGTSGDGTACGNLLQYTSSTSDTIASLLRIVHSPTTNVSSLFGLVSSASPFQPALASAPTSLAGVWSVGLNTTQTHDEDLLLADSQSHIWLLQPSLATLAQYDSNLNLLHSYGGGPSLQMALDPSDNLWIVSNGALFEFGSDGSLKSPTTGYPLNQTVVTNTGYLFTTDSAGNVWFVVERKSDLAWCVVEYSGAGVVISPPTGYCGSETQHTTTGFPQIVADSSGNVYVLFGTINSGPNVGIEKFTPSGSFTDIPARTTDSGLVGYGIAVFDPKFQHIWTYSGNSFGELDNLSLDGTVNSSLGYPSAVFAAIVEGPNGQAVDGGGNLWSATESGGALAELDHSGNVVSSCTTTTPKVCGVPANATSRGGLAGIAIDPAGDIFTVDFTHGALLKLPGLATAK
jgi:hypothetical protein